MHRNDQAEANDDLRRGHRHDREGEDLAVELAVMAVAASEVAVGLGLIVAMNRRKLPLDVDRLRFLRG